MKKPLFSIIIPARSLSFYLLSETLPALNTQKEKSFECIVVPDQPVKLDSIEQKKYSWLRIIPSHKKEKPAAKRNRASKYAKGGILAFLDDDAFPRKDWLAEAKKIWQIKQLGALGGPGIVPPQASFGEKIFDAVLISPLGSGAYTYRFIPEKQRQVDDYPAMNFFIRKKIFAQLSGFRTNYWPGEDSKLCEDLQNKLQEKIVYSPHVLVYHHRRNNLIDFLKQHMRYGYHRGLFFGHGDVNSRKISYFIPPLIFIGCITEVIGILIFFFSRQSFIFAFILLLPIYICLGLLTSHIFFIARNRKSVSIGFISSLILILLHLSYGLAFWVGLVHPTGVLVKKLN